MPPDLLRSILAAIADGADAGQVAELYGLPAPAARDLVELAGSGYGFEEIRKRFETAEGPVY